MDKLLFSRTETAAMLNLSARSVDYLTVQGHLPSKKFGKRRLYPRYAVERLARTGCGRITPMREMKSK